jgi:hypothetical protein
MLSLYRFSQQHSAALPGTVGCRRRRIHSRSLYQLKGGCGSDSELSNLSRLGSFEQVLPELNSEVIDFRVASELLAPYKKVQAQTWTNLRVTSEHQRQHVPTIGGLLLFGKDRLAQFPDSWIQIGRFAGTNRTRHSLLPAARRTGSDHLHEEHLAREAIMRGRGGRIGGPCLGGNPRGNRLRRRPC